MQEVLDFISQHKNMPVFLLAQTTEKDGSIDFHQVQVPQQELDVLAAHISQSLNKGAPTVS